MQDFISVLKIFAASLAIILLMQLKVSNATLENHFEGWIQNSTVVTYLQGTADGANKLMHQGVSFVTEYTHDKFRVPENWKPLSKAAPARNLRSARSTSSAMSSGDDGDDDDDDSDVVTD